MIPQIKNLISWPGKENCYCPICLGQLEPEKEMGEDEGGLPDLFLICGSNVETHYFSTTEDYYTLSFDLGDEHYIIQPHYGRQKTYMNYARRAKGQTIWFNQIIDDFNFQDLNSIAERVKLYFLFS